MYHYLFTNDLRISTLDESLQKAGHCFATNTVPSSAEDKSANNNMMTLGFYFNLTTESNCAKVAASGNVRSVVLNFIKKFQFPNMRTTAAFQEAFNDGIKFAPMREIVKILYTMNLLYGKSVAYLTKEEILYFLFYNENIAKGKNTNLSDLINDIVEYRKTGVLPSTIDATETGHEWKHEDRQIREMLKVLLWSGCITEKEGKYVIDNAGLSKNNKSDIFDIINYSSFWDGNTIDSYRIYMDIEDYETEIITETEDVEDRNKRRFRRWMGMQVKPDGDSEAENPYSKTSIDQYVSNISTTPLVGVPDKSVFYTTNVRDVEATIEALEKTDAKNHTQKSALKKYVDYLLQQEENSELSEEILKHNLWGIHIKEKNDALSETNPHVCIGWSGMGDLSELETTEEIMAVYEQAYETKNNRAKGQDVGMIRRFLKEVRVGDYIIFAESSEFHIGRIESDYYYDDSENPNQSTDYTNNRKVKWLKKHISRKILSKAMHNSLATAMSIFGINDYRAAVVDLLRGTYKKDEEGVEEVIETISLVFRTNVDMGMERNRIVFGAPGTGKSYQLKSDSKEKITTHDAEFERVTFHPDYSYSQFVGTYKPVMGEDGEKIKYEYVPGPFMRVLVKALKSAMSDTPKPYILIIEEINRAKVAAVFGEVFQLLDRDKDGVSEYEIQTSEDLRRYLEKELGGTSDNYQKIRIPNNMFIWATMNSADQGVFPMDTAFKRRWNFEYIGINDSEEKLKYADGRDYVIPVGMGTARKYYKWNDVRKGINEILTDVCKVNEDKLLGPFFLSKDVLENATSTDKKKDAFIKAFESKIIMYLFEDVMKMSPEKIFKGHFDNHGKKIYSDICQSFENDGIGIFGLELDEVKFEE